MAGTVMNPAQVGAGGIAVHADHLPGPAKLNTSRIKLVLQRLAGHVCGNIKDPHEFCNLCLVLTRSIDFAIANGEVPEIAHAFPFLLKQVCQQRNDCSLQAAIMVLMISVKNACKAGWFSVNDSEELLKLANEMGRSFCTVSDINTEASSSLAIITRIMSRFYPRMKMGQILAFLEAKPGYGTYVVDFHISRNAQSATDDNIQRLLVAQLDNVETSSCLISPPQVSFLLNGKGVDKRTNVTMETGPQIPTVVSHLLKYGSNLLQAVGQFNGNYIILVAFMSVVVDPDPPVLDDYVQPANAARDSDPEIVEGTSRISLNCPISFRRIKTPVKGHSCNHLQCFDFDNFMDINSRRPNWRCPHCNQYTCYADIRVDQYMVKVLREVGENVVDVIISGDGSWKAVIESNDQIDKPRDETVQCQLDEPTMQDPARFSETVSDVVDLTGVDDMTHQQHATLENEDRKPIPAGFQMQSNVTSSTIPASEDHFWSGMYLSSFGSEVSGARSNIQIAGGVTEPASTNWMLPPVLAGSASPSLNREPEPLHPSTHHRASSVPSQAHFSASNNLQLQQQFGNSVSSNEYGRFPIVARHRTPIAVQALPAQPQHLMTPPQQRSRNSLNNMMPNGSLSASPSQSPSFNGVPSSNMEWQQQQFSRPHPNQLQASRLISSTSSQQQNTATQNWDHQQQNHSIPGQTIHHHQQIVGVPSPTSQLPSGGYRGSTMSTAQQNLYQQHQQKQQQMLLQQQQRPLNSSLARGSTSQTPPGWQPSAQTSYYTPPNHQVHLGGGGGTPAATAGTTGQQAAARMVMARAQSPVVPTQTPRTFSSAAMNSADLFMSPVGGGTRAAENSDLTSAEQNWQPAGRMRGSLSGRAIREYTQYNIIQPSPPVQAAARPPEHLNSTTLGRSSQLHVLASNNRNAHASSSTQPVNVPSTQPPNNMAGGGGGGGSSIP